MTEFTVSSLKKPSQETIVQKLANPKGKCELCSSSKGERLIAGIFDCLCKSCQDKAEIVIQRFSKYLLSEDLETVSKVLVMEAKS